MAPKISILIPVYNAEKYVSKCLDSLLKQTFTDFEIICLNDGSSDNSFDVCQLFARQDKRIRALTQKNAGVARTRNRLVDEAQAQYIAFVDADDWVEPTYVEKLYQKAQETGADITKCFFKEFDTVSQKFTPPQCSSFFYSAPKGNVADKVKHGYYDSVVWGKLWRIDFLRENNLRFLEGHVAEDVAWVSLGFGFANQIVLVEEELYIYRKGVAGAITSNQINVTFDKLRNVVFLGEELKKRNLLDKEIISFLLKILVWNMCNLRKLPKQIQQAHADALCHEIETIKNWIPSVGFWKRIRFNLWVFLAGDPPSRRFYFWSKIFR